MSEVREMSKKLKVLDLFSGIGGFSLGLDRTGGFETVAFCEIEEFPQKVLKKHWPDVPKVNYERLKSDGISRVDVVTGGFPCQDLSAAGNQAGITGARSGLWGELCRIISEFRPRYALVENVSNLLSGEGGRWFDKVLGDLAEIGYDCQWHCIPAAYVGLNHHRDRAWIIAYPKRDGVDQHVGLGRVQIARAIFDGLPYLRDKEIIGKTWIKSQLDFGRVAPEKWRGEGQRSQARPLLLRDADGLSRKLDGRLKGCGNAVVPQIPELIGRAILDVVGANDNCATILRGRDSETQVFCRSRNPRFARHTTVTTTRRQYALRATR